MKNIKWGLVIDVLFTIFVAFSIGKWTAKQEYISQTAKIEQLQKSLDHCENMWKLDASLFYPELCKTVCVEEFEKMSC